MIRKSLYLAASAAVLLTAAQAQAASITGTGTFSTVTSTTTTGAYKIAEELTFYTAFSSATAAAATQGTATFNLVATSGFTRGESLLLTVDLTGGVFASDSGFVAETFATATCDVTSVVPVTPIEAGATSAQYLVTLGTTASCATGSAIAIEAPVQLTGSNMTIGAMLQQSFGGTLINVDGGRTSARFVTVTSAFDAEVTAASEGVTALVAEGYREFNTSSAEIGTVEVTVDSSVNVDLSGTDATDALIDGVDLTATALTGSFTGFNLASDNEGLFDSATTTATLSTVRVVSLGAGFDGTDSIYVVDNTSTATTAGINADAVIPASTFSLSASVDLADGLRDFTASGSLAGVERDGTSFVAPWIALGATSANSTIRLANNGSTDTGPIQMTLTSSNGTAAATTETVTIGAGQVVAGSLTASGGIPAGGVVSISGAALKTAFGTDAANGDLEVTIEAQPQFISGKVRVTQASGQVFESSLGNLSN
ncbi:hypothetical protein GVN18_30105 [Pseudomonas sp. ODNR1LW]|nr:hypothetical protein [Pseudomonas sp. ODNR1LW]